MGLIDIIKENRKKLALAGALGSSLYLSGCIVHGGPREMSNFVFKDIMGFPGMRDKDKENQNQIASQGNNQGSNGQNNSSQQGGNPSSNSSSTQGSSQISYRQISGASIIDNGPSMDYFFECNFYNGDSNNNRMQDFEEFSIPKSTFHKDEPITFVFRVGGRDGNLKGVLKNVQTQETVKIMTSPIGEKYSTHSIPYIGNSFEPGKYSLVWEAGKDLLAERTIEIK